MEKTLSIVLDGNTFKYEVEATVKIFYPATQFNILYDVKPQTITGDYVYTNLSTHTGGTTLSVEVRLGESLQRTTTTLEGFQATTNTCEYTLCKEVYQCLSTVTGKSSAWGLLTGIRPVKRYVQAIQQGLSKAQAAKLMEDTYLVSGAKSSLAYDTALTQIPMLNTAEPKKVSVYVSIPFCNTRCAYCSFVSHSIESAKKLIPDYVYYLCREIESLGELVSRYGLTVDTVYFGGGTPTSLEAYQLRTIMEKLQACLDLSHVREYCVEAGRPDTITREKLETIKRYGADRVSVNPQTFNDQVLQAIGRRHSSQQTIEAFQLAREVGFTNVNMDLIAGLPTDTLDSFMHTIDTTVALNPESVTVHTLTLKRSATLFEDVLGRQNVNNPVSAMVDYSVDTLTAHGYLPYYLYRQKNTAENLENVGYAKPGKESLYNVYIMDEIQTILGVGAGASTKLVGGAHDISRVHNYKYPYEYINRFGDLMAKKSAIEDFFSKR